VTSAPDEGHVAWDKRVFLAGQAVSLLGDGLAFLAIPLLVLELSRNPLVSAISAASLTLGYLLVGLPSGALIDRFNPLRVLMTMDGARALLFILLFVLAQSGLLTVWLILAVGIVSGACTVFFENALVVVVKDLFSDSGLIRANSTIELANQLSLVLGPAAAGILAATIGIRSALIIDALTYLVSLLSLLRVWNHTPQRKVPASLPSLRALRRDIKEGFRYLLSVRLIVVMTAIQMVVNFSLAVEKLIFFYARDTLRLSPTAVGVVVAAGGVGGILGALSATYLARRVEQIRLIIVAFVGCGIAIAAMSVAGSFGTLLLANLAYLWALIVASLVNRTQRQRIVPRELLGRVTSTVRLFFLAVDPLGVLIAGTLTASLGNNPRPVFLGAGVLVVTAALAGWFFGLRTHAPKARLGTVPREQRVRLASSHNEQAPVPGAAVPLGWRRPSDRVQRDAPAADGQHRAVPCFVRERIIAWFFHGDAAFAIVRLISRL